MAKQATALRKKTGETHFPKFIRVSSALVWAAALSIFSGAGVLWLEPYLNPQPKLFIHVQVFEQPYELEAERKGYGPDVVIGNSGDAAFEDLEISLVFSGKGNSDLESYGHTAFHNARILEGRIEEKWVNKIEYRLSMHSLNPGESFNRRFHLNQPTIVTVEVRARDFFHKQHF